MSFKFFGTPTWVLGETTIEGHRNFGNVRESSTPQKFANSIFKLLAKKKI